MAILTLKGHVARAKEFYNKTNIYAAIGKSTPWDATTVTNYDSSIDYDANPPAPSNTDEMLEIIGYKKIEFRALVVQDDSGTLEYRGTKWKIVTEDEAFEQGARWVFLSTTLTYNELPTSLPYRQIGLFSGLEVADGVSVSQYALLPSEVKDNGLLEVLDNRKPVYRDNDVREQLKLVIEF